MSDYGYHFVGDTLRDCTPIPPDGEWLEYDGDLVMCKSGLHYSREPYDALTYAPGKTLCRVEVEEYEYEYDKGVARRRRIERRFDATELLHSFARRCALDVIHLWDAPDIVRLYLESGDKSLRTAAEAAAWTAWDAAKDAAWDAWAAWAATRATWDATRAAWDAAKDAAWAATTRAAAETATRDAQRERFNQMVKEAFGKLENE